ncbi:MAG: hypothetical protein HOZ81_06925 [Streptomyces sp.]|nr:hypothetical protein [Streptomyces sp.]NUS05451.1 hypothetical protein [Nonomuraea sp.]
MECGKPTQGLPSGGYPFLDANELSARRGTLAVSTDMGDDTPLRLRVRLTSRLR